MTNGFLLNHEKNLQINFCIKHQAKNDFLKAVESTVVPNLFVCVCVEVLRPSQPNGAMLSMVSLPNHTFTGQA